MHQRINLITLAVADIGRARAFYEKLGWRASSASMAEIVFFETGGLVVGLYGREALAADTGLAAPSPGGITLAVNVASAEEVDRLLAEVRAAGAGVLKEARDMPWGGRTGYFTDPDGHPWEITWVEAFPLDERGRLVLPE